MIKNSIVILDTHALLWSVLASENLSEDTKRVILTAQNQGSLFLSTISLWEIAMLSLKKRISIYEPIKTFLTSITNIQGLVLKDISAEIAAESVLLTDHFHGDPADRLIVATARIHGVLTRDQKILTWANNEGYLKTLAA